MLEKNITRFMKIKAIILFCFVLLVSLFFYKAFVIRSFTQINFLFPPKDFWLSKKIETIKLTELGLIAEFDVEPKYPGQYVLTAHINKPLPIGRVYETNFGIKIQVIQNRQIINEDVVDTFSGFWGKERSGLTLKRFELPNDWNVGKVVKIRVLLTETDNEFEKKYGTLTLFFEKGSDE